MPKTVSNRWRGVRIYTIGHSTRTFDELVALLRSFDVAVVADIRTIPRSRHNPQFEGDALKAALRRRRLQYVHLPRLGGLRRPGKDATNSAWRNQSFRGYADYMQTDEFAAGLAELGGWAAKGNVALMCAEAVPWRCHRSLVADALTARGARVEHITGLSRSSPHRITPFAVVEGARVTYPGERDGGESLATPAPFHLEATVRVLQRRPSNRVDVWDEGRYQRVLTVGGALVWVEVEDRGTVDAPDLRYVVSHGEVPPAARPQLAATLRKVLGLDVDPAPLLRLTTADRRLRPTGLALRGMRPPRFAEWFEVFANVVPFQQVSLDAGAAVVARLVERFGRSIERAGRRHHAFPSAPAVAEARLDTLRACGLSARKAEVLRHLARAIASGELAEATIAGLATRDALATLGELPGIGPWSAALVLLRGLGRLDVFPPGDVGVARGLGALMRVAADAPLDVERFGDRRGYLYFCALGGDLLARGLIHAAPPPKRAPASRGAGAAKTSKGRA
jgi:3-methyladenine DNA glycosylase/8-oxoguanine DNA glycosylase